MRQILSKATINILPKCQQRCKDSYSLSRRMMGSPGRFDKIGHENIIIIINTLSMLKMSEKLLIRATIWVMRDFWAISMFAMMIVLARLTLSISFHLGDPDAGTLIVLWGGKLWTIVYCALLRRLRIDFAYYFKGALASSCYIAITFMISFSVWTLGGYALIILFFPYVFLLHFLQALLLVLLARKFKWARRARSSW